jgi:DNA helicase-2/ATP-dependent DNA helicase PcrA
MQSIYDDGIGNIKDYVSKEDVKEVPKKQNRRNPRLIYELANILRTDEITQTHSNDSSAPNMEDEKNI